LTRPTRWLRCADTALSEPGLQRGVDGATELATMRPFASMVRKIYAADVLKIYEAFRSGGPPVTPMLTSSLAESLAKLRPPVGAERRGAEFLGVSVSTAGRRAAS
jgi:hypothetical protein